MEKTMGPVQLMVFGFQDGKFSGKIMQELRAAEKSGAIRLVDLRFVNKDQQGNITGFEASGLTPEERERFGAIVGGLIGLGAGGREGARAGAERGAKAAAEHRYGMTKEHLAQVADLIPNGSSAAIVLFELTWAGKLMQAVREAGGTVLAEGLITAETLVAMGVEMAERA